jgi:hypothetical protein
MSDQLSLSRRRILQAVGATGVGVSQFGVGGATPNTPKVTQRHQRARRRPEGSRYTRSVTQDGETIHEDVTVSVDREKDKIRYTLEYQVPDGTDEFAIAFRSVYLSFREVVEREQFEWENVEEGTDRYVWDGTADPRLVIEDDLTAAQFDQLGYYTDTEVLSLSVPSSSGTSGIESQYTLDGEGFINRDLLFSGPHEVVNRDVYGTELAVIEPEAANAGTDLQRTLDLIAEWYQMIGGLRLDFDSTACLLLPSGSQFRGSAIGGSFVVSADEWVNRIGTVFAHEFAHVVFGVFGDDKMYWLKEAVAEYYGYLLALNAGLGDSGEFLDTLATDDQYEDAVLTDTATMLSSEADYDKGAHVLGALDAEIRERTNGAQTLRSIFESPFDLSSYDQFRSAVTFTTADLSMEEWVDRYVDGPELPSLPDDLGTVRIRDRAYVDEVSPALTTIEPGESFEITADIEPIQGDYGTAPVEVLLQGEQVVRRDVDLSPYGTTTVTITEEDLPELESGSYDFRIRVGAYEKEFTVTVTPPPDFRVNELELAQSELPADDSLRATIEIRNIGNEEATKQLELVIVDADGEQVLDSQAVSIGSLDTETVSLDGIDLGMHGVDPGEYTLVARTEDDRREQSVVIEEPTADSAEATSAGSTDESRDETGDDASGPGFGIGSTLAGLGGLTYVVKRRLGPEPADE